MSLKRLIVGLIIVTALVAVGYRGYLQYLAPVSEDVESGINQAVQPPTENGPGVISAEGQLVPIRHARLSMQQAGVVAALLVKEGESVSAGDPLIILQSADLEVVLDQARSNVAQAEATVASANASLTAAQAGLALARTGVDAAEAQLDLVQSEPRAEEIVVSEAAVAVAGSGIVQAEAARAAALEISDSRIKAAEAQVAAAAAEHIVIQQQYDQLLRNEVSGSPEEQTRFALNASTANLRAAQAALDQLNQGASIAQQGVVDASVSAAESQLSYAQSQLDLLLAPARAEQIEVARIGVDQAEAAASQAEALTLPAEAAVTQAEAARDLALSAQAAAQLALDKMTLRAPFSGVVAAMSVKEGELLAAGIPVVTLADFSRWQVETTDVTELDVVAIAQGDPVTIHVDAIAEDRLPGKVTDIARTSSLTRGDVTYVVTISLDDVEDLPLRWGMTVFVDIEVK